MNLRLKFIKLEFLSLHYLFGTFFVFFALLPYVNFGLNSRDSQPWPLLFATLFILFNYKYRLIRSNFAYLLIPVFALFVWFFFSSIVLDFISLRAFINYLTFSFCILAFIFYLREYGFPWKLFITVNVIYIFIGFTQLLYPEIVSSIVTQRGSGASGRGVTSLAAEPTAFGLVLFFFSFIYIVQSNFRFSKTISYLTLLNVFSIIFLAGSSTVVLFLLIASILFFLWLNIKLKVVFILFLSIISYFVLSYLEDSRIMFIIMNAYERGFYNYVFFDESINDRVAHVIFSIQGSFVNNLLPGGFNSFVDMQLFLMKQYEGFFYYPNFTNSILSYFGTFVYELGFLGYLIFLYLFFNSQNGSFLRFVTVVFLFIILNSGIPISFPFVAILFAILINTNYINNHRADKNFNKKYT